MAETMFGNMFDVTTSENQNIRDRALKVAQLQPGRASVYGAGVAGGMLMQNLASMAGMKTPEQEKTELISGIMDRATNLDPNDPSSYMKLANDFVQAGLPGIGQKFMDKSRSVQVQNTTSAQKDRELDQKDDRLTADTDYRTSSLDLQNRDLSFRTEKEETRIEELQAQLERDQKIGVLQQITDSEGNTILAQITTDDEGNYSVKPITQDVVEASMSGGATQGAETTTQSGKFSFNNQGALIVKAAEKEDVAPIEEIDDDANTIYKNLLKEYETTFKDRNAPMMSTGSQLAVPETGEFSNLESVPDPVDYMIYKTIEKIENRGGVVDSMYDLYMGPGAEAMEALMKGNGMANLWAENKARFEKEGDTTLYSMEGRQTLIDGTLKGIITSPIAFDVKLKQDHTTEDGTMLAKKGETFDDVMSRLMSQDITAVTRDDEGNITGFQPPEQSAFFNFNEDLVKYIAQDIVSKEDGFKGLPEITGTADTRLPEMDYNNQNVANTQVTAELVNNNLQSTTEAVMGDTTEFDKVVKENGNIVADVAKDIKRFVLDIFTPKEHKDSAPENPIKSGFGSDAWSLRLLSVKVSQFDTAKKNADGKYELEMPLFIEVKDAKIRQAYQEWKARNFNYFFRQGITLPNARVMPK
jgi:hypothetical protein